MSCKHKRIGVGKTMPKGNARPLGTPSPRRSRARVVKSNPEKAIDTVVQPVVRSAVAIPPTGDMNMVLTYKGLSKNGLAAFYGGPASTIRIQVAAFVNKEAPDTISVQDGVFAEKKVKLTKEQRAALPKPTLAEKIARREALLARDKAKLEAANAL